MDNTIPYLFLILVSIVFSIFVYKRLCEKGENQPLMISVFVAVMLIIFPLSSPITLYFLMREDIPKKLDEDCSGDQNKDVLDDSLDHAPVEKSPSIKLNDVKIVVAFVVVIIIMFIIISPFIKKNNSVRETDHTFIRYDLPKNNNPISPSDSGQLDIHP